MSTIDALVAVHPTDQAGLLEAVATVAAELEQVDKRRAVILEVRRALFEKLRALDPPCPNRLIANAAGIRTEEGVTAVLARARKAAAS